jgi:hypothetical protein
MVAPADLRRLSAPYRTRFAAVLTAADQTLSRLYMAAAPVEEDEWTATATPVVQGMQEAVIGLAAGYTAAQLELFLPDRRISPALDVADRVLVDRSTSWLSSPVLRERKLLADGLDPIAARRQAAGYAGDLFVAEARVTERAAATATYQQHWKTRQPLKYKRIVESGACGWCRVVADRLYSADDSGKWHKHCRCTWRLITPDEASAHEPQYDNDRWRDVIGEPARRPATSRRPDPPDTPGPPPPRPRADPTPAASTESPTVIRRPSETVEWKNSAARREFEPLLQGLDELHSVGDDLAATVVVKGGRTTSKGGSFSWGNRGAKPRRRRGESGDSYRSRYDDWRNTPPREVITVHNRADDGTGAVSFLHEYGHRLDFAGQSKFYSAGTAELGSDASEAMLDLMSAMRDTPTIANAARQYKQPAFVQYFRDPTEMWARAYSQWAANQLGGPARDALVAQQRLYPGYQWPDEEFDRISPLVERVLDTRGMMT